MHACRSTLEDPTIVDPVGTPGHTHLGLAEAVLAAGARFFQLRVKGVPTGDFVAIARAVKAAADRAGAALIINDRADVAKLVDAAGVHLGQDDLPPHEARRIVGEGKIIGFSTHSAAQLESALRDGSIDYVGFGPVFATGSKINPDRVQGIDALRAARRLCSLPLVAIGGIDANNVGDVLTAGADAVALIGAIARADDPLAATRTLLAAADAPRRR